MPPTHPSIPCSSHQTQCGVSTLIALPLRFSLSSKMNSTSPTSRTLTLSPGSRYRVLKVIGRGSFGVVSLCEDLQERPSHSRHQSSEYDLSAVISPTSAGTATPSLPPTSPSPLSPLTSPLNSPRALASPRRPPRQYVMKQISITTTSSPETQTALQEVRLLKALQHPFIVKYKDSWIDEAAGALCVIMSYCSGGDLHSRIQQRKASGAGPFDEGTILDWFIELCLALRYCHDRKLLHRDIKTQNVTATPQHTHLPTSPPPHLPTPHIAVHPSSASSLSSAADGSRSHLTPPPPVADVSGVSV